MKGNEFITLGASAEIITYYQLDGLQGKQPHTKFTRCREMGLKHVISNQLVRF